MEPERKTKWKQTILFFRKKKFLIKAITICSAVDGANRHETGDAYQSILLLQRMYVCDYGAGKTHLNKGTQNTF